MDVLLARYDVYTLSQKDMKLQSRLTIFFVAVVVNLFSTANSGNIRLCPGDDMDIRCDPGEVIVTSTATFGRMEFNECLIANDFIGCENDVLFLVDKWCSGRGGCMTKFPNRDIELANKDCLPYLKMYLQVSFSCLKVSAPISQCHVPRDAEGVISSHMTGDTGCGSATSPWVISADKGKTIIIDIVDFGSESLKINNKTDDLPLYGYIRDGSKQLEIFGSLERKRTLYHSKKNEISVEFLSKENAAGFLLLYKKRGCPDLTPPAHAWYKRDGDQAVIGCEWSQKTWHLSCDGHSWSGVVGNCSELVTHLPTDIKEEFSNPTDLWLVCLVSVAFVVIVVVCVTGIVCVKRYKIKQDVKKSMTLQKIPGQGHYDLDPNIEMASMLYLPYKVSMEQQQQQQQGTLSDPHRPTSYLIPQDQVVSELTPLRIWERPLPDLPVKPLVTGTISESSPVKPGRTPGDGDEAISNSNVHEIDRLQTCQSGQQMA